MEPQQIREGYLVKKRTLLNYWTTVWVVLSEDGLEFYKKKTDQSPKGMIPLKGATLISPCQDCGNRTLVFKITTHKKQEHFFQASHVEERELWVKDIKRAIQCLQGGKRFARRSTRRSIRLPDTVNLTELYTKLRDQDEGVKELKLERENRIFNHCFTGSTVVEWLISKEKARNRPEALMLATGLLNEGFLQPAGDLSKEGAVSGEKSIFLDQTDAFYYFADSGFFCEGYSSDEDTLVKEEFRGNIVKQGCLLKQGDDPLGSIYLRGSVVTAVDFVPDAKRYDVDGNLFEIITSDETHYFLQAATAEERKEWIEAVQEVSKSGK
ncbi:pleckstrin isoform X3 [Phyllopteryx taeniolatus]|uniref:pleckstrin isoform X3 n=1 Tax=Phyllopteryx taeniolatus TaxID=161469 RepID=UPI002AD279FB|nr:pleckstrin isoform X3 [Phyllopteryx taeniolatus]